MKSFRPTGEAIPKRSNSHNVALHDPNSRRQSNTLQKARLESLISYLLGSLGEKKEGNFYNLSTLLRDR